MKYPAPACACSLRWRCFFIDDLRLLRWPAGGRGWWGWCVEPLVGEVTNPCGDTPAPPLVREAPALVREAPPLVRDGYPCSFIGIMVYINSWSKSLCGVFSFLSKFRRIDRTVFVFFFSTQNPIFCFFLNLDNQRHIKAPLSFILSMRERSHNRWNKTWTQHVEGVRERELINGANTKRIGNLNKNKT